MPSNYYTDIDFDLTKNAISNDISLKYDLNAIAQSIKNIVLVNKGEKLFNSSFGANANFVNFSSLLPFQLALIKMKIFGELQLQETRATIQNIDIKDSGSGYWQINVSFTPIFDKNLIKTITINMQ
jgi:phage baseplate assembly protein W